MSRQGMGIFCTVARTEFKEKFPEATDEMLRFINYVATSAYDLGNACNERKEKEDENGS